MRVSERENQICWILFATFSFARCSHCLRIPCPTYEKSRMYRKTLLVPSYRLVYPLSYKLLTQKQRATNKKIDIHSMKFATFFLSWFMTHLSRTTFTFFIIEFSLDIFFSCRWRNKNSLTPAFVPVHATLFISLALQCETKTLKNRRARKEIGNDLKFLSGVQCAPKKHWLIFLLFGVISKSSRSWYFYVS